MTRPWCECDLDSCMEGLPMDEEGYVREKAAQAHLADDYDPENPAFVFIVLTGHEAPDAEILKRGDGYLVIWRHDADRA